jgi:hypothetical protein
MILNFFLLSDNFFLYIFRYYVGVVDKKKGKMRVYDSEIMQMVPKLPG